MTTLHSSKFTTAMYRNAITLAVAVSLISNAVAADSILARVNGTDVKADEIRPLLESLNPQAQAELAAKPAELNQAIRMLLVRRVVLSEAQAQKWDQTPAFTSQLDKLRETALVESYLQSQTEPPADFPSAADLKTAYEANKAVLQAPRQYRLAQIFVAAPKGADTDTLKKAQAKLDGITKQLAKSNADFAAIARTESDEKDAATKGGELGWLAEAQVRPEIRDSVTSLSKGASSKPVQLADGWHILKLLDVRESRQLTFDEVKSELVKRLRAKQSQTNRQAYLAKLREKNPITVNELAVAQMLSPSSPSK
ncbi:MAG: peptidylprolyl isomerase [Chthoniobacteraceae bacterium]